MLLTVYRRNLIVGDDCSYNHLSFPTNLSHNTSIPSYTPVTCSGDPFPLFTRLGCVYTVTSTTSGNEINRLNKCQVGGRVFWLPGRFLSSSVEL